MDEHNKRIDEAIRVTKEKLTRLPIGFIVGAAIGGGLYLYATKKKRNKSGNFIINAAKIAAPFVITTILDRITDSYEAKLSEKENPVVEAEDVEII